MSLWEDHMKKYDSCENPVAQIKIKNKEWKSTQTLISHINITASTGCEAGTCLVEFTLPEVEGDKKKLQLNSDFAQIKIGVELEILLGYNVDKKLKVSSVFVGYISTYDVEFFEDGHATVTIQGMDAKMWLMSSRKTELKLNKKKYSQVVSGVYTEYAKKFKGKMITVKGETEFQVPIYQRNESDYEFLCRIASLTGVLFFVSLGKLYFISPDVLKSVKLIVSPSQGIYNVRTSMSIWGIPKTIEVLSIDTKNFNKSLKGSVTTSDMVGAGKGASKLTTNISSVNDIKIIDNTLKSVGEAKFIAQAEFNKREFNLVEGYLEVAGNPDVALATGLKIKNMGDPIDNTYIVTGIEHEFFKDKYITKIRLNTNRFTPQK